MATASPPPPVIKIDRVKSPGALKVSAYDQVSSVIIALLIMLGLVAAILVLIWFSSRFKFKRPVVPISLVEELGGGGSGNATPGAQQTLEEVSPDEVSEVQEVPPENAISSVAAAVAEQIPNLDAMPGATGFGKGEGEGTGDGRGKGPGGPGTAKELPSWEVRFNASTLQIYAGQLDYFGIELAAMGGGKTTVEYASNLANAKPTVRIAEGKLEGRRYLIWRKGPLAAADKELLKKAGIDTLGRVTLQFLPPPVAAQMAELETRFKNKKTSEILRTVFGVKGTPGKYEFFVIEQDYRG